MLLTFSWFGLKLVYPDTRFLKAPLNGEDFDLKFLFVHFVIVKAMKPHCSPHQMSLWGENK